MLSLPFALRYRLAYDAPLVQTVLDVFVRCVFASLRRRARKQWAIPRAQCGAVTFVQRFGDALNLNVHFHSLVLDGVYARSDEGGLRFHPLPPPDDAEVERVARQVARLLERRGLGDDTPHDDALAMEEPLLASLYAASITSRVALGPRAGARVVRFGDRIDADDFAVPQGERCASVGGVSIHADVAVPARDRHQRSESPSVPAIPRAGSRERPSSATPRSSAAPARSTRRARRRSGCPSRARLRARRPRSSRWTGAPVRRGARRARAAPPATPDRGARRSARGTP